jgi:dynein heavy chain, axonemal
MPALTEYGAQPPIELIRQWMDYRGWYDRKAVGEFRNLVDINFCAAMGPPGGGRNPVTLRLTRHFNHLSFVEMEDSSMKTIFSVIFNWWISNALFNLILTINAERFVHVFFLIISQKFKESNEKISECCTTIVDSCIEVYKVTSAQLLPTPAKSHYTFNLRDLSKVFQGMLMTDVNSIGVIS